jgi:ankyrin repeat protein
MKENFYLAIKSGRLVTVKQLLAIKPDLLNARDEINFTPLHWAASEGQVEIASLLISAGADVHARDDDGETPLFGAAESSPQIVQMLLNEGVDINTRNREGKTILHELAYYGERTESQFVITCGANINIRDNNSMTPLHYAALAGLYDEVELLVNNGAKLNSLDNRGFTPLHLAVSANIMTHKLSSYIKTVEILIKYGADILAQTYSGKTALDLASRHEFKGLLGSGQ